MYTEQLSSKFWESGCFVMNCSENVVFGLQELSFTDTKPSLFPSFFFDNFFLNRKKKWVLGKEFFQLSADNFILQMDSILFSKPNISWLGPNYTDYKKLFSLLDEKFKDHFLHKGVPFTHVHGSFEIKAEHILYLVKTIFKKTQPTSNYLFGIWDKNLKFGIIGSSPEVLFLKKPNHIKTLAVAGTFTNHDLNSAPREKLNKLFKEHKIVVSGLEQELNSKGEIKCGQMKIIPQGSYSHFVTDIDLYPKDDLDVTNLLQAIHPSAALGGFPKENARSWLDEIEKKYVKRYLYGSVITHMESEQSAICIGCIRAIHWQDSEVFISAGGGVVKESVLDEEWLEIQLKIKFIRDLFEL